MCSFFLFLLQTSFYSEDSTFVHGCFDKHGDVVQYVRGQKQISGKISSLNFNNCHTKIRQVDSMETIGNGVVIQVGCVCVCSLIFSNQLYVFLGCRRTV